MEEKDHFTQTQLPALTHYCTWQQGCCPWQPLTFSLWSLTFCTLCSVCSLTYASIYRHEWCHSFSFSSIKVAANSSSSSTMMVANFWHFGWVHMVGTSPAAAVAIVNGCCTLMATNPTMLIHTVQFILSSLAFRVRAVQATFAFGWAALHVYCSCLHWEIWWLLLGCCHKEEGVVWECQLGTCIFTIESLMLLL